MKEILRELYLEEKITIDYVRGLLDAMRIDMETYLFITR
jgi:hypothetical protein